MRAAHRSLFVVIAVVFSVVAVPAHAADDSPSLLDTVGKTVDSVTKPLLPPKPAPSSDASAPTGPVTQLTSIVDSALGGTTSLSGTQLVSTVDTLLTGGGAEPATSEPAPDDSNEGESSPQGPSVTTTDAAVRDEETIATNPFESVMQLDSFSAPTDQTNAEPAAAEVAHIPGTSTLPDGGSPLTLTWLVLAAGLSTAGATIIRRLRTH